MICEKCKTNIPDKAKFCPKCGAKIEIAKTEEIIFCPKCGTPNPLTAKFCKKDGTPLKEGIKPPVTVEKEIKPEVTIEPKVAVPPKVEVEKEAVRGAKKAWLWIAVCLFFIIIAGVGSYLYFSGRIGKKPSEVTTVPEVTKPQEYTEEAEEAKTYKSSERIEKRYHLRAVIEDPDGYTNVRSLPNINGEIITVVKEGEIFYTHIQEGDWWLVKTKDGKIGYIHSSRIKIIDSERQYNPSLAEWGVITGSNVILRVSPFTSADVVTMLNKGDRVKIIQKIRSEIRNEAVTTRDENIITETGYVSINKGKAVKILKVENSYSIISCRVGDEEIIGKIPTDAIEKTFGQLWYQVKTDKGKEGWVYGAFLRKLTE